MSMNTYPFVERAAFYIDAEVVAHIILGDLQKNGNMSETLKFIVDSGKFDAMAKGSMLPIDMYDSAQVVDILQHADVNDMCYANDFDGEVNSAFPSKTAHPIEANLSNEYLVVLVTDREIPRDTEDYAEKEALLKEFRSTFKKLGVTLPADFDWWAHIVSVSGTYCC